MDSFFKSINLRLSAYCLVSHRNDCTLAVGLKGVAGEGEYNGAFS